MKIDLMPSYAMVIAGLPGSGKSTAANYFKKYNWASVSAGDVIRDMCRKEGLPTNRKQLQDYGAYIYKEKGYDFFADILISNANRINKFIIDGVRNINVVEAIKIKIPSLNILYIESTPEIRKLRLSRSSDVDDFCFNDIESNHVELDSLKIKPIADYIILNNDDLSEFYIRLEHIEKLLFNK